MRLGHAERTDSLTLHHSGEPLTPLRLGSEGVHIGRDQITMDHETGPGEAAARHLLEYHHVEKIVEPETAVLFRDGAAEQACLAGLQPYLAWHDPILLPLMVVWTDLPVDEPPNHV